MINGVFTYFNKKVNIFDVLDKFGVRYYGRTDQTIRCPSPVHGDSTPSAHIYSASNVIKCFGCNKVFGVLNFYLELRNLSLDQAVRQASRDFNIPIRGLVIGKVPHAAKIDLVGSFINWLGPYINDSIVQTVVDYVLSAEKEHQDSYVWFIWAKQLVADAMKVSDSVEKFKCEVESDEDGEE